jgi:competence protein ComEA
VIIVKNNIGFKENMYIVSESEFVNDDNNFENTNNDTLVNEEKENEMITIYISGQVNNPGVVSVENDKRLIDAIEILGGTTKDADLNRVNMALKVEDEGHYIIPKIGEEVLDNSLQNNIKQYGDESIGNKININTASISELDDLPGVGEATANKIYKYREENGNFKSIEEIKSVNGIGDKKYEDIKDLISIN